MNRTFSILLAAPAFFFPLTPAPALIFFGTADPEHNLSAPTGELEGSGWEYQGRWGGYTGIPIAPQFFLSVEHVGKNVGETFEFRGTNYTTVAMYDDPESDLRIWKVSGTFPAWAPLYTKSDEVGKQLVVFGRGGPRGSEIRLGGELRGWGWTNPDLALRWGTNVATAIYDGGQYGVSLIGVEFNPDAGADEVTLASGDSGGGAFLRDGPVWKLAGINSWIDGPYNTVPENNGSFNAALFKADGYFYDSLTSNGQVTTPGSGPGMFYLTRISARIEWIQGVIGTLFSNWSGGAAPADDANNDGVSNLLAYAVGAPNPFSDASNLLPKMLPDGSFSIEDSSQGELLYEAQLSEDLVTWFPVATKPPGAAWTLNPASGYPNQPNVSLAGDFAVTLRDNTPNSKKFWRLDVAN